jgi:hypothetical protein
MFGKENREHFRKGYELGSTGSLLRGPAIGTELLQRWGPRPDFGNNVRLRYFYFSLEAPGHITSRGHCDFFASSF